MSVDEDCVLVMRRITMRKIALYSIFNFLSYICIGLFAGSTISDAINYNKTLNSAPFYVFVLANAVTFLLPGVVFAVLAYFFKKRQKSMVSVPESEKSRAELLQEFSEYDSNKDVSYDTQYHLGGDVPSILEKYGFSDYIKDVDATSDEIVFKMLAFVCDHFGHDGGCRLTDKRNISGLIEFCESNDNKANCRGLSMLLASLLRLIGVKARHITCMPYEDPFRDCHVVVDCLLPSGKRVMLDPTYRLYLIDEEGEYVSIERLRALLLKEKTIFANEDASYNGGDFDLEYYRNYMTKNTIRFSRGTLYQDGLDDYAARAVELVPADYPIKNFTRLRRKDFVFDDREFWRM